MIVHRLPPRDISDHDRKFSSNQAFFTEHRYEGNRQAMPDEWMAPACAVVRQSRGVMRNLAEDSDGGGVETQARTGRRARKKQDKLGRIKAAAYQLFSERGYDDATLREVAALAGVGFGTIFAYAHDKRDLLFLLFAGDIARLSTEPFITLDARRPLVEQLLHVFSGNYQLFARNPALSRVLLREITFDMFSPSQRNHLPDRSLIVAGLTRVIAEAQARGRIGTRWSPELVATTLYSTYSGAVRQWLRSANPVASDGIKTLREMLLLQVTGIQPRDGEV
jgi:AcrR family transcriptional regulator